MVFKSGLSVKSFWDEINKLEREIERMDSTKHPPYDIIHHDEESASIQMALAGYAKEDISVKIHNHKHNIRVLEISCEVTQTPENAEKYEYQGIARRKFRTQLPINEAWKVRWPARFENGMLTIDMIREVPEEQQTQCVDIV